jgi:hypothetical protein
MNRTVLVSASLAVGLLGCGDHSRSISVAHGHLTVYAHEVRIEHSGAPDARITEGGMLRIGSEEVALTPEQKTTAAAYYAAAMAIPAHGIATGKAGAEVGVAAVKEVASGLARGDTSQIGAKVEAKADAVKEAALQICADLEAVRAAQESLAASLDAFKPYAVVTAADVGDCARDLRKSN